jgi:uncharacterized protein (TIGR01777 family)
MGLSMPARPVIVLTGASGLIGQALTKALTQGGYDVRALKSRTRGPGGMDVASGWVDDAFLEGSVAVIHLAGEPIAQRWTKTAKARILSSRVEGTRLLAAALARLQQPPQAFISMSGINRYGVWRPGETVTEASPPSHIGFLAEISEQWEEATQAAVARGIRTVWLRTGVVLAGSGGALQKMRLPFSLGLGGPVGTGQQNMSWIRLGDLVRLIQWSLATPSIQGALNAVSPQPVNQATFARCLGQALHRPAILPLPAFAVGLVFGEMGRETLLGDLAATPAKALAGGFVFETPDLPSALRAALCE